MNLPHDSLRGRIYALFLRSEPVRGFALLSPTLLVMLAGMCVPFAILVAMSFWTQHVFEFDTTLSLTNYNEIFDRPMYRVLLTRSLAISGACTMATVLLAYPMAYYVAFHVHRHKMLWIVLMTLPFWSSYLLRVFAWKIVLGYNGAINSGLMGMGWIQQPLEFCSTVLPQWSSPSPTRGRRSPSCRSTCPWRRSIAPCWKRPRTSETVRSSALRESPFPCPFPG